MFMDAYLFLRAEFILCVCVCVCVCVCATITQAWLEVLATIYAYFYMPRPLISPVKLNLAQILQLQNESISKASSYLKSPWF